MRLAVKPVSPWQLASSPFTAAVEIPKQDNSEAQGHALGFMLSNIRPYAASSCTCASANVSAAPLFGRYVVWMNHSHRSPAGNCARKMRSILTSPSATA